MTYSLKHFQRLERLHLCLKAEQTGTATEIAQLLGISQRTLRYDLGILKDWGAELCYDRKRKTYRYCDPFELSVHLEVRVLMDDEMTRIIGGQLKKVQTARELQDRRLL
ncbi:MAG: HTH domain-containing protein [Flavobacteriaceae bacterium]